MRFATFLGWLAIVMLLVAACGDVESHTSTATQESPGPLDEADRQAAVGTHPHDKLPLCDDIERPQWPEGVPTPAQSGSPALGAEGQSGNVRCRATPTVTDTPRPGWSGPDDSDGLGGPRPYYRPTLDVDYDDSWVANIPSTIGGYRVLFINTPKSKACSHLPLIGLQAPRESKDTSSKPPLDVPSLKKEIHLIPGVPESIRLSFSPGQLDPEATAKRDRELNEHALKHGCTRLGGLIPE